MLDSSTLSYASFADNRRSQNPSFEEGQSGMLLIGTDEQGQEYIVKHSYPHNAANEYVACWLAKKLGVPAPNAYLLSPNKAFRCGYAVAIEFLDLEPFDKAAAPYPDDLIAQFALSSLIILDDMIQLNVAGGHIVSYDFSESFCMSNMNPILTHLDRADRRQGQEGAYTILRRLLTSFRRHISLVDFNIPGLAHEFNLDCDEMREGMIEAAKRTLLIADDEIEEMSIELENLYPMEIAVYYEECIRAIQNHMKGF